MQSFSAEKYATGQSINSRGSDYDNFVAFFLQVREEIDRVTLKLMEETPDVFDHYNDLLAQLKIELMNVYDKVERENAEGTLNESLYEEAYHRLNNILAELEYILHDALEAQDRFENQPEDDANKIKYQEDCDKVDKLLMLFERALDEIEENYSDFDYEPYAEEMNDYLNYLWGSVEYEWNRVTTEGGEYQSQISDEDFEKGEQMISEMFMAAEEAGVDSILDTDRTPIKIYNLGGNNLKNLNKGINILVYPDGSIRKIMVK